MPRKPS